LILKKVKVLCFDTDLEVFVVEDLTPRASIFSGDEPTNADAVPRELSRKRCRPEKTGGKAQNTKLH
jgi:hypothetical protein